MTDHRSYIELLALYDDAAERRSAAWRDVVKRLVRENAELRSRLAHPTSHSMPRKDTDHD